MANYFEDDVRIVISPRMAVGPQGANAPEVQVQYSSDGSNWHDTPQSGDMYLRFSTDGGDTWGEPVRLAEIAIDDQITDGVTDRAPSQNAVYDALATKIGSVAEDTTPELGGELDAGENTIVFTERVNTSSDGAVTIDWTKSNHQTITLTEDTTFTFTPPSKPCNLTLRIKQDGTGGWTVSLPTVKTSGGAELSFTTTANAEDLLMMYFDGTNYIASVLQDVK